MTTNNVSLPNLNASSLQAPSNAQLMALRQANAAQADQAFNQMLSKQLDARRDAEAKANAPKAPERQASSNTQTSSGDTQASSNISEYDSNAAALAASNSASRQADQAAQAQRRADATSTTKSQPAPASADSQDAARAPAETAAGDKVAVSKDEAGAKTDGGNTAAAASTAAANLTMPADLAALVASLLKQPGDGKAELAAATTPGETTGAAVGKNGNHDAATLAMLNAAAGKAEAGAQAGAGATVDDAKSGVFAKALGETAGEKLKAAADDHADAAAADKAIKADADPLAKVTPKTAEATPALARAVAQAVPEVRAEAGKATAESTIANTVTTPTALQNLTQSAPVTTAAAAQSAATYLPQKVGSDAWNNALGQKVVWMAAGGEQSATITINPPDLGPLQVVLSVSNTQANASFSSAQPEVRQALEAAMPKLREMLGDAGIQLGQATVDSGASQQNQASFAQSGNRGSGGARGVADNGAETGAIAAAAARIVSRGDGMVDTFA